MEGAVSLTGLLHGELRLTLDVIFGLFIGELIIRFGIAERIFSRIMPRLGAHGIGPVPGLALAVSIGSARTGAAILASALDEGKIDRRTALWGGLMLSFPAYLHRWPATFMLGISMAGTAGGIFTLCILLRSAVRFFISFLMLRRGGSCDAELRADTAKSPQRPSGMLKKALRTLPAAWLFFALAYAIVPFADDAFRRMFTGGTFLPLAGWTVAAASIAHISSALALAGGSLSAGDLTTAQAVFALMLGNCMGILTRALRQNAGYYFGLFPADTARSLLFWNIATMALLSLANLALAAVPLL